MCSNVWDPKNTGSSCHWHNNSDLLKTTSSTVSYSLYELFIWLESVKKLFFLGSSGGFFVMSFIHITRLGVTYIYYRFFGCAFSFVFCQSSEAELHTICERWVCGQVENKYYFASLSLFSCNCFRHRSPGHAGLTVYAKSFCFCRFVLTPTWR